MSNPRSGGNTRRSDAKRTAVIKKTKGGIKVTGGSGSNTGRKTAKTGLKRR